MPPDTNKIDPRAVLGEWQKTFTLNNVAIHATLLPNGKILYWGRRKDPTNETSHDSLNEKETLAYIWDPTSINTANPNGVTKQASKPKDSKGRTVNLFCSGHILLPDGRVLVVGGHIIDGHGLKQACIYNPGDDTWTAQDPMNDGRWYPSALTLPDGTVFVASGSHAVPGKATTLNNINPQIWVDEDNGWVSAPPTPHEISALYPRLHLTPKGRIFMVGPLQSSMFLTLPSATEFKTEWHQDQDWGRWVWTGFDEFPDSNDKEHLKPSPSLPRSGAQRNEAPSVMYDSGKIVYIGGGGGANGIPGTNTVETIDLYVTKPEWKAETSMNNIRRQHNATVLPDGTVLVTGGSRGPGFNNLDADQPVKEAELWDPVTDPAKPTWTKLAGEEKERCYHSISLLLPDGQVLSAGGGEYQPDELPGVQQPNKAAGDNTGPTGLPNKKEHSIKEAQLFKPPYFFKNNGRRPAKPIAPSEIVYDKEFEITVGANDDIRKISLVRLGSVTHSCNMNQSLMFLDIKKKDKSKSKITVQAPSNPILAPPGPQPPSQIKMAPPGHYMLFVLDQFNIPSEAPIVLVTAATKPAPLKVPLGKRIAQIAPSIEPVQLLQRNQEIIDKSEVPPVTVGLKPGCPYGLAACWGGAFEALRHISDVDVVRPVPSYEESVAHVYLKKDVLPDIDVWRSQFQRVANGSYVIRGIEVTLAGTVTRKRIGDNEHFTIVDDSNKAEVFLAQLQQGSKVQWDRETGKPQSSTSEEAAAFVRLSEAVTQHEKGLKLEVTGPLQKTDMANSLLEVREWEVVDVSATSP